MKGNCLGKSFEGSIARVAYKISLYKFQCQLEPQSSLQALRKSKLS